MTNVIEQLINGLQIGSVYALIALGYTMVYGIAKLINFAHGDIIMVGAYTMWGMMDSLLKTGDSPQKAIMAAIVSVIVTIAACSLLGVIIEKLAYKPLRRAPRLAVLITAIGVSCLLQNLALALFSATPQTFRYKLPVGDVFVGGITVSGITIVTLAVTIVCMICLVLFIQKTKAGNAMRAVSEDREAAGLMGINVNKTISLTFAIGSALAAVASILYLCQYPQIKPTMGALPGIKAFVAAVIGGIGNIPGAFVGGIILGIIENMSKAYISSELSDAIVFGMLIVVLLVKPSGILGHETIEKV